MLAAVQIPFEIYWGIDVTAAQQIFRDRNLLGVALSKNLALGMDSRDLGTIVAGAAAGLVEATAEDGAPFASLVERRKRQLGKATGSGSPCRRGAAWPSPRSSAPPASRPPPAR